jgi:geranylgeranyl diphosphate synthase type II
MTARLSQFIAEYRDPIEQALRRHLPRTHQPPAARLNDALAYALFPGGKRWRPLLTMLGAALVGGRPLAAIPAACALEYLHTSSIILDDLPAMDDADFRRGRPALHQVYGESVALLASLALLNESYALLARAARLNGFDDAALWLVEEAARCIGGDGMIGGQVVDLVQSGQGQKCEALASRNLKTTALMRLTMNAGAMACGATRAEAEALGFFGDALGMAYQICDDLLDEVGESELLGKPAGQDARHARASHVNELGLSGAHQFAVSLIEDGLQTLQRQFGQSEALDRLADAATLIVSGGGQLAAVSQLSAPPVNPASERLLAPTL